MTKQHFDNTYSTKGPENYERYFVSYISKPLAKDLVQQAILRPGEKVLDVACGTGIVARLASREVSPEGSVAGLDANPGMLALAKSISADQSIEWYEASAEAMPLTDDTFDTVFCQLSLQFLANKVVALKEMRRLLVPDGKLLLNVPGPIPELFKILGEAMKHHISNEAAGFVYHVFSVHDTSKIEQLISQAGFTNIEVSVNHKTLLLPEPKEFLWQYVYSTPLRTVISEAPEESQLAMEQEVVKKWNKFTEGNYIQYQQRIVTVNARK
jgi:ubiquinone/menaquinone biosynthesis C-methylase UbiE